MEFLGVGAISTVGRGVERLHEALSAEVVAPSRVEVPFLSDPFPVFQVSDETLKDRAVLGGMRRADRFSKMAALAAYDAMQAAGVEVREGRLGILLSTAFGPHRTTFSFLDEILDYGDAAVSPTVFSHSVHGAAVSYIANLLQVHGPTWTMTQFDRPFSQALTMAQAWLDEGRVDYVLVGAADECGPAMEYICQRKLPIAQDGVVRMEDPRRIVPGEGALFFVVGRGNQVLQGQEAVRSPLAERLGNMLIGEAFEWAVCMPRK
jgi:3-oxoacyl-[acyl-carrier-protein] synthase II